MRTIYLTPNPHRAFKWVHDHLVVTPNGLAARAFGVPALSLDALGGQVLEMAGRHVATELIADSVLRGVIQDVLEPLDLDSAYETTSPLISELLRVGVEPADLQKAGGKVLTFSPQTSPG